MTKHFLKVPNANIGKGFIRHDDVEVRGIRFVFLYQTATDTFLFAEVGEDIEAVKRGKQWLDRVGGTRLSKSEVRDEIVADLPATATATCNLGHEHTFDKTAFLQELASKI